MIDGFEQHNAMIVAQATAMDRMNVELAILRDVAWAAQFYLDADAVIHPTMSPDEALREGNKRLRETLGKWHQKYNQAAADFKGCDGGRVTSAARLTQDSLRS